jgi:hypothetical protein
MPAFICTACGAQYPPSETPPAQCTICEEERQYVPLRGQTWTTLDALAVTSETSALHSATLGTFTIYTSTVCLTAEFLCFLTAVVQPFSGLAKLFKPMHSNRTHFKLATKA